MKIMKLFFCLFVVSTVIASADVVKPVQIWCENTHTYTNAFFVFDDNGRLLRGTGIDCFGNAWSREYETFTGSNSGRDPLVWIAGLSPSVLRVSANESVELHIVDLAHGSVPVGNVYHLTAEGDNGTVSIDISTLVIGTYGLLVIKDGGILNLITFDKR